MATGAGGVNCIYRLTVAFSDPILKWLPSIRIPAAHYGNDSSHQQFRTPWITAQTTRLWGAEFVISRAKRHYPARLPGFIAASAAQPVGLVTFEITDGQYEIVTIDSLEQWQGIGTKLLGAVVDAARHAGCRRVWMITTNDNLSAIRFYQRRGLVISAVYPNALEQLRKLKPSIPLVGENGIPLRDEIEFEHLL